MRLGLTDKHSYFEIIKNPMDLSTAQAKLAGGLYASRQDFADDMHLIVANCHTFNLPGSAVYRQGDAFEAYFQSCESSETETY
jgi:hypothetical protein